MGTYLGLGLKLGGRYFSTMLESRMNMKKNVSSFLLENICPDFLTKEKSVGRNKVKNLLKKNGLNV